MCQNLQEGVYDYIPLEPIKITKCPNCKMGVDVVKAICPHCDGDLQ